MPLPVNSFSSILRVFAAVRAFLLALALICAASVLLSHSARAQANDIAPLLQPDVRPPGPPRLTRAPSADYGEEQFTFYWAPPADNGGGRVLGYKLRRSQINLSSSLPDPALCHSALFMEIPVKTYLGPWDEDRALRESFPPDAFEATVDLSDSGETRGNCYRWHVRAYNAAGDGPEAITAPIMGREDPASGCASGVKLWTPEGYGICAELEHLEAQQWCKRQSGGDGSPPTIEARGDEFGNDAFNASCCIQGNFDCGGYIPRRYFNDDRHSCTGESPESGERTYCALNINYSACGAYSEFNENYRDCRCEGLARPFNTNFNCQCAVEGANAQCECPAGTVHHPDLNACGPPLAAFSYSFGPEGAINTGEAFQFSLALSPTPGQSGDVAEDNGSGENEFSLFYGDSPIPFPECENVPLEFSDIRRGACDLRIPVPGVNTLWAQYRVAGENFRNESPPIMLTVFVAANYQHDCENANPLVNPAAGEYSANQCEIGAPHFYAGSMTCHYDADGVGAECYQRFADMRAAECLERGLVFRQADGVREPDLTCVCPADGALPNQPGDCPSLLDALLLTEIRKDAPDLATVSALLNEGADPNRQNNGAPYLLVAASLGHAEVVSVLIVNGANPESAVFAQDRRIPHYFARNESSRFSWRRAAENLIAFGDAVSLAGAAFQWNTADLNDFKPVEYLRRNYDDPDNEGLSPAASDKAAILLMAAYLRAQGEECMDAPPFVGHPVCVATGPACPVGEGGYSCGQCAGHPLRSVDGQSCRAACETGERQADDGKWLEAECMCASGWAEVGGACVEIAEGGPCGVDESGGVKYQHGGRCLARGDECPGGGHVSADGLCAPAAGTLCESDASKVYAGGSECSLPGDECPHDSQRIVGFDGLCHVVGGACPYDYFRRMELNGRCGPALYDIGNLAGCEAMGGFWTADTCSVGPFSCDSAELNSCEDLGLNLLLCNDARKTRELSGCAESECAADETALGAECVSCPNGTYQYDNTCYPADGLCPSAQFASAHLLGHEVCGCPSGFVLTDGECKRPPDAPEDFRVRILPRADGAEGITLEFTWRTPESYGLTLGDYRIVERLEGVPTSPGVCETAEQSVAPLGVASGDLTAPPDATSLRSAETGAAYGLCFAYEILATTRAGESEPARARVYIQHPPDPPMNVSATLIADGMVALSWEPPMTMRGANIQGYRILREAAGTGWVADLALTEELTHIDASTPSGATLRYWVRAESGAGPSPDAFAGAALVTPGETADYNELLAAEAGSDSPSAALIRNYLALGANPNATNSQGVAALLLAAANGRAEIVALLMSAGANPNASYPVSGKNAAHLAAEKENAEVSQARALNVLLAFGNGIAARTWDFNWNGVDASGTRPLEHLYAPYLTAADSDRKLLERMAAYMIARGAACRDSHLEPEHITCKLTGPGLPENFSLTALGDLSAEAELSWDSPAAGTTAITGYKFWRVAEPPPPGRSDCEGVFFPPITEDIPIADIEARNNTARDILADEYYGLCLRYGAAATSANGNGPVAESNAVYIRAIPARMPAPSATLSSDGVPLLSWSRLTNRTTERRGSAIEGYHIQRLRGREDSRPNDGIVIIRGEITVDSLSDRFRDGNAPPGQWHSYRIRALGDAGPGGWSGESRSVSVAAESGGACMIGELADADGVCRVIGASCGDAIRRATWSDPRNSGTASCACPEGWDELDSTPHCARRGDGAAALSGELQNPPDVQGALRACAGAGYGVTLSAFSNSAGVTLGWQARCQLALRRVGAGFNLGGADDLDGTEGWSASPDVNCPPDLDGPPDSSCHSNWGGANDANAAEETRRVDSYCLIALQHHAADPRRRGGFLSGEVFCYEVFPDGVFPSGHDSDNPYVYGECPAGEYLDRKLNRCARDCASGERATLGRGYVSGLTLRAGDSTESDLCGCPDSAPFVNGGSCVAACLSGRAAWTGANGISACVDAPNASGYESSCAVVERAGTYAADDMALLCAHGRDVNDLANEVVYTSGRCWLSARPNFPRDNTPSCADFIGVSGRLPDDFSANPNPLILGECPADKILSGAECVCAEEGARELGSHCVRGSGDVIGADDTSEEHRRMCRDIFGGTVLDSDGDIVCAGVDEVGTFCLMGSRGAFPCEGLLKHVRECNFMRRSAASPFLCGADCGAGSAVGAGCRMSALEFRALLAAGDGVTVVAAAGYSGVLVELPGADGLVGGGVPRYSVFPESYFSADAAGGLRSRAGNILPHRSGAAVARISHRARAGLYFDWRVQVEWVDAPRYREVGANLVGGHFLPAGRINGVGHPGGLPDAGARYELRGLIRESDGRRMDYGSYYDLSPDGRISGRDGLALPAGRYRMEAVFTHARMLGEVELTIPLIAE